MKNEITKSLEKYSKNFHIFNLSHGVLPNTPIENVKETINIIKNHDNTSRAPNYT